MGKNAVNEEAKLEQERLEILASVLAKKLPKVTEWDLKRMINLDVDGEAVDWPARRLFESMVAEFVQPGDVVEAMQAKTAATVKAKLDEAKHEQQRKASLERLRKPAARKPARGFNYAAQEKRQAGREAKTVKRLERAGVIKPEPAAKGAKTRASAAELVTVDAKVLAAGLKSGSSFAIGDVLKSTSLTRIQAASALERLIAAGRLVRAGKGRGARYQFEAQGGPASKPKQPDLFEEGDDDAPRDTALEDKLLKFAKWCGEPFGVIEAERDIKNVSGDRIAVSLQALVTAGKLHYASGVGFTLPDLDAADDDGEDDDEDAAEE